MTPEAERTLAQIAEWRQAAAMAREREAEAMSSLKRWKGVASAFAAAALILGAFAVLSGLDLRHLRDRVGAAEGELEALRLRALDWATITDGPSKEPEQARADLRERDASDWDIVERLGQAQERLGICEDALQDAVYREEIYRHRWRRREADYLACSCELDGRPKWCSVFVAEAEK